MQYLKPGLEHYEPKFWPDCRRLWYNRQQTTWQFKERLPMATEFTPEQEQLIDVIYQGGGFNSETEVVSSALELLRQQRKLMKEVNAGVAALNAGEYTSHSSEDGDELAAEIIAEAKAQRAAAES